MPATTITIPSGDAGRFSAYLAKPAKGKAPGIVIAQEIFGVNNALRQTADELAGAGFLVAAPDLFWRIETGTDLGYTDADRQKAMGLMGKFDAAKGVEDIGATIRALKSMPECSGRVAVVGFCLGGTLAYLAAARAGADAAVSYYGTAVHKHLDEAKGIQAPLLLHFGETDNFVPAEAVQQIRAALAGKDAAIHVYPKVGHAFCNVDRAGIYNKEAATTAHARTIAFLKRLA